MTTDPPLRFELNRLLRYDEQSIIVEMQRVANLLDAPIISRARFDSVACVSSDTCIRRFGGWSEALAAAGLGDKYSGKRVSRKMRIQPSRVLSRDDIVVELRRVAEVVGRSTITRADVLRHSDLLGERVILNRFGSWKAALDASGLELSSRGRRWSGDDYFENLLTVWTHYGRSPHYAEMDHAPSRISSGGYAAKFGSWGKARVAFIERVNADLGDTEDDRSASSTGRCTRGGHDARCDRAPRPVEATAWQARP